MYGIPHSGDYEDYDPCARAFSDVFSLVERPKRWTPDDIARAHRVGQSRNGEPKPMIIIIIDRFYIALFWRGVTLLTLEATAHRP